MRKEQHFELIQTAKIGGDNMEIHEIDIEIESLTNCLISTETGEEFDTVYKEFKKNISKAEADELNRKGWLFDWSLPQKEGYSVYGLYIVDDDELQGLIAFRHDRANYYTDASLVESAPINRVDKKYKGVGGHLFAIAGKESFIAGNDGYVCFTAKTNLVEYYAKELGAVSYGDGGRKMAITTLPAANLVKKYFKEEYL